MALGEVRAPCVFLGLDRPGQSIGWVVSMPTALDVAGQCSGGGGVVAHRSGECECVGRQPLGSSGITEVPAVGEIGHQLHPGVAGDGIEQIEGLGLKAPVVVGRELRCALFDERGDPLGEELVVTERASQRDALVDEAAPVDVPTAKRSPSDHQQEVR